MDKLPYPCHLILFYIGVNFSDKIIKRSGQFLETELKFVIPRTVRNLSMSKNPKNYILNQLFSMRLIIGHEEIVIREAHQQTIGILILKKV